MPRPSFGTNGTTKISQASKPKTEIPNSKSQAQLLRTSPLDILIGCAVVEGPDWSNGYARHPRIQKVMMPSTFSIAGVRVLNSLTNGEYNDWPKGRCDTNLPVM